MAEAVFSLSLHLVFPLCVHCLQFSALYGDIGHRDQCPLTQFPLQRPRLQIGSHSEGLVVWMSAEELRGSARDTRWCTCSCVCPVCGLRNEWKGGN